MPQLLPPRRLRVNLTGIRCKIQPNGRKPANVEVPAVNVEVSENEPQQVEFELAG